MNTKDEVYKSLVKSSWNINRFIIAFSKPLKKRRTIVRNEMRK